MTSKKERERTEAQSPLMANKVKSFTFRQLQVEKLWNLISLRNLTGRLRPLLVSLPNFVEAVRFQRAFEEVQAKSLQPGQEGQALVGFGDFKFESLESLFVKYLRKTSPAPGTQMENAVQYVRSRDRGPQLLLLHPPPPAAASPSAASQRVTSASQPLGSALMAFVSGRRSLSAVEMQAQVKKLLAPRPAATVGSPGSPSSSLTTRPSARLIEIQLFEVLWMPEGGLLPSLQMGTSQDLIQWPSSCSSTTSRIDWNASRSARTSSFAVMRCSIKLTSAAGPGRAGLPTWAWSAPRNCRLTTSSPIIWPSAMMGWVGVSLPSSVPIIRPVTVSAPVALWGLGKDAGETS
ncbi:uncharacterized protein LOC119198797 [Pungitius pungitius]|uniref:uncharacterized protein LOC119198797 n=1 Tax=Pungitius pungitius TaxID=134920 RepID=UPI002E13D078